MVVKRVPDTQVGKDTQFAHELSKEKCLIIHLVFLLFLETDEDFQWLSTPTPFSLTHTQFPSLLQYGPHIGAVSEDLVEI